MPHCDLQYNFEKYLERTKRFAYNNRVLMLLFQKLIVSLYLQQSRLDILSPETLQDFPCSRMLSIAVSVNSFIPACFAPA